MRRPLRHWRVPAQSDDLRLLYTGGRPVRLPDHRDGWRWEPYAVDGADVEAARQQLQRLMRDAEADIAEGVGQGARNVGPAGHPHVCPRHSRPRSGLPVLTRRATRRRNQRTVEHDDRAGWRLARFPRVGGGGSPVPPVDALANRVLTVEGGGPCQDGCELAVGTGSFFS